MNCNDRAQYRMAADSGWRRLAASETKSRATAEPTISSKEAGTGSLTRHGWHRSIFRDAELMTAVSFSVLTAVYQQVEQ